MTGIGWSAITLACHGTIVLSILFLFMNAVAVRRHWNDALGHEVSRHLTDPVIAIGVTIIVERCYYIVARMLEHSPVNLWQAHPAPEILSVSVASSMFWLAVSVRRIAGDVAQEVSRIVAIQSAVVVAVFLALAWGLY